MYPKHLNQTNRTMNVTIEHVFCRYSDEAEEIYFRIMNTILFATDETEKCKMPLSGFLLRISILPKKLQLSAENISAL